MGDLAALGITFLYHPSPQQQLLVQNQNLVAVKGANISPPAHDIVTSSLELGRIIEYALSDTSGDYGISLKNLKTNEHYTREGHKKFDTASLYKLWVMATVYDQINKGTLDESDVLSQDVGVLNSKFNIATESAELTEGTITFTVADALEAMITKSDNYAALLLSERVRLASVASFLKGNGFSESSVGTTGGAPMSTPHDISLFFEKLYNGELVNPAYAEKMLVLLKAQQVNHKIPKYLSDAVVIAHKTGELDGFTHDAGIVYTDTGDYVLVILSKSNDPRAAEEVLARTSESIYTYFISQ